MSTSPATGEAHFVIGGAGFLGSRIALALKQRGEKHVSVFDLNPSRQPIDKVEYYTGDITSESSLRHALIHARDAANIDPQSLDPKQPKGVVIYHTASPIAGLGPAVYEKVNVTGTETVIRVAQKKELAVTKLVFTSSAGVVYDGSSLINVDERMPYPEKALDAYNETKAKAEQMVLEANSFEAGELRTCALRPAGIFGIGDRQALPGFFQLLKTGRTNFQIGDNTNLFDYTYVDNVVHAHLLAADKLFSAGAHASELSGVVLDPKVIGVDEKAQHREVPTSEARPDTPAGSTDYARRLPSTLSAETLNSTLDVRPVARNRYDQFFHIMNPEVPSAGSPLSPDAPLVEENVPVAGETFFITNGQPIPFWDFPRALWAGLGHVVPESKVWKLSKEWGLTLAGLAETFGWLTGREVQFTKYKVTYTASARYYNIEKARRVLGYEPIVGMPEAIRRSVAWWKEEHPEYLDASAAAATKAN
ncbi:erg26, C-3 sterol dehydrogenase [Thecaphora frezii]